MNFTDLLLPLLLAGVIGVVGITFWLAWLVFKAKHKDQLEAPALSSMPPFVAKAPEEIPLLKLIHAPTGAWEITVNGHRYPTLAAVPDDAVRQEVVAGLKALVTFARSYVQQAQPSKRPPPAPSAKRQQPVPPLPAATSPPIKRTPPPSDKARVLLKGEETLKRQAAAPVLMPTLDLAREIGDIVAEMQTRIPSLSGRSIRLQNAPGGGVQFAIDGIVYPDVASIPDLDIQALIRAATQEWERR